MKLQKPRLFSRKFSIPQEQELASIIETLSPFEKAIFGVLVLFFAVSSFFLLGKLTENFIVEIPSKGGSLSEGVIGSPRFINPLLAISDADRDLTTLVYSGLLRATPEGGLELDLAESYTISDDGLSYTFVIRDDATFHDGEKVTADDVLFTIQKAQDPTLKSPKRANWDGVFAEYINEREIRFTLRQPYAPFLQNATLGILPEHIWGDVAVENFPFSNFNSEPIGSGPYKIRKIKRDSSGVPELYDLRPFKNYMSGEPYLSRLTIRFYPSKEKAFEAYRRKEVESLNSVPFNEIDSLGKNANIQTAPLPRIFGVFFNQNQAEIFAHKEIRLALNRAIDKDRIVSEVLAGYGTTINSPLPPGVIADEGDSTDTRTATEILEENGWKQNENGLWEKKNEVLTFSLATSNTPELKRTAELLKEQWEAAGINVEVKIFEPSDLSQNVIRPRRYDALLFGEIIGRDLDLFAFWHSSQRNDPGLNIALYTNITTDKLLEEARVTLDRTELIDLFEQFNDEIQNDVPAVFLYSPDFIYVFPEKIKGAQIGSIATPSERFLDIYKWHTQTEKVWYFLQ